MTEDYVSVMGKSKGKGLGHTVGVDPAEPVILQPHSIERLDNRQIFAGLKILLSLLPLICPHKQHKIRKESDFQNPETPGRERAVRIETSSSLAIRHSFPPLRTFSTKN